LPGELCAPYRSLRAEGVSTATGEDEVFSSPSAKQTVSGKARSKRLGERLAFTPAAIMNAA